MFQMVCATFYSYKKVILGLAVVFDTEEILYAWVKMHKAPGV